MPDLKPLPTTERLCNLVGKMAGTPIVMVADFVADRFISGSAKRISREAPVLILSFEDDRLVPGGGANAVANVAALGGRPLPLGIVGDDSNGSDLVAALAALGVETSGIVVRPGYRTPTKTRILGGGAGSVRQQIVRYDIEESLVLSTEELNRFQASLAHWIEDPEIPPIAAAVFSDYGYGSAGPETVGLVRELLPQATFLGDSRHRLAEFSGLDGATPNQEEAEELLGGPLDLDLEGRGRQLLEQLQGRFLLITRGSRGMSLFSGAEAAHLPVHGTDQVADVTGAGDTVIGTFALATAAGATPLEAAALANYAGGVVVMKTGTATLDSSELRRAVTEDPHPLEALTKSFGETASEKEGNHG